jgi:transposase InsO family protein
LIRRQEHTKAALAKQLGISRASLYYTSKQLPKDWALKNEVENVLREHPGYGSPRVALALGVNEKRAARVMRLFGIQAYRRRGRRPRKSGVAKREYPNLIREVMPTRPNDAWVADFTYLPFKGPFVYVATVMDYITKEVVGVSVALRHDASLVLQALFAAVHHHPRPKLFHSDNGREYGSKVFTGALSELGVQISRSKKACPWENGLQESFYSQFKVDLGDPNRFKTLGELVYEIHHTIWTYNHTRIHSVLKVPPFLFADRYQKLLEKVS